MYISDLDWDDYRVDHIARHDVEPYEVWEICEDPLHLARRQGRIRYRLYGQTADGRYLFVVLERVEDTVLITIKNSKWCLLGPLVQSGDGRSCPGLERPKC